MRDKRNAPRRDTIYYLPVIDARSEQPVGRVVDVSDGGMMMVCDHAPEVGTRIAAVVSLPDRIAAATSFQCILTVRWRRPDHNPALTLVGCQMEVGPGDRDTVRTVSEHYSFHDS